MSVYALLLFFSPWNLAGGLGREWGQENILFWGYTDNNQLGEFGHFRMYKNIWCP